MRQGIVLFCGSDTELAALGPAVIQAISSVAPLFVAYPDAKSGAALKVALKGTASRFFPQASRESLGERLAQAFAFLFIQGYEAVALVLGGAQALDEGALNALFSGLAGARVAGPPGAIWLAIERTSFPEVAFLFDTVLWDKADARERAEALLSRLLEGGVETPSV